MFAETVDLRLTLPAQEQQSYAGLLALTLEQVDLSVLQPQYFVLVDRNANVQSVMVYWKSDWRSSAVAYVFIGASPASTGNPGEFEHFRHRLAYSNTRSPISTFAPREPGTHWVFSAMARRISASTTLDGSKRSA